MLRISNPSLIFMGQRLYHTANNVEKPAIAPANYKIAFLYQTNGELTGSLKEMADKLVVACKFKPEEAVYMPANANNITSIAIIKANYGANALLIFGNISISRNMAALKKNVPYELNGIKLLRTESLETLQKNGNEKMALWEGLKKMFGI
jgi:hypothetical protein